MILDILCYNHTCWEEEKGGGGGGDLLILLIVIYQKRVHTIYNS